METIDALDRLGGELERRGYLVMLHAARPRLEVVNRDRPAWSGDVLCECGWYWWSWADRIAPADNLDRAVAVVDGLLSPPIAS